MRQQQREVGTAEIRVPGRCAEQARIGIQVGAQQGRQFRRLAAQSGRGQRLAAAGLPFDRREVARGQLVPQRPGGGTAVARRHAGAAQQQVQAELAAALGDGSPHQQHGRAAPVGRRHAGAAQFAHALALAAQARQVKKLFAVETADALGGLGRQQPVTGHHGTHLAIRAHFAQQQVLAMGIEEVGVVSGGRARRRRQAGAELLREHLVAQALRLTQRLRLQAAVDPLGSQADRRGAAL
jgi:hypothetical protein